VASYNPWVSLSWLVTGKTVGGTAMYPAENRLDRERALRLWTEANAWFSSESGRKGAIVPDQWADLAVLSADYFTVPDEEISGLSSVLTILGGKIVHGSDEYQDDAPPLPPAMPDWSPVRSRSDFLVRPGERRQTAHACVAHGPTRHSHDGAGFWGHLGCSCWAF
jgi:hypothetical protein